MLPCFVARYYTAVPNSPYFDFSDVITRCVQRNCWRHDTLSSCQLVPGLRRWTPATLRHLV